MSYLLDTNIFLWWLSGDRRLEERVKKVIAVPDNLVYVSVVSAWEISIKHKIGKLPLKTSVKRCFEISNFQALDLKLEHIFQLDGLPFLHKDPFDRLLIAQSMVENLSLITSDEKIWKYNVSVIKA